MSKKRTFTSLAEQIECRFAEYGGKGRTPRPCPRCGVTVQFGVWREESYRREAVIWHWYNENGSHHICGHAPEESPYTEEELKNARHLTSILEEE